MTPRTGRREILAGGAAATFAMGLPMPAVAQQTPIKIGLLTVKTGPLAQGGIQMEQGAALFLKHHENRLAGRPAELLIADTGGISTRHVPLELVIQTLDGDYVVNVALESFTDQKPL